MTKKANESVKSAKMFVSKWYNVVITMFDNILATNSGDIDDHEKYIESNQELEAPEGAKGPIKHSESRSINPITGEDGDEIEEERGTTVFFRDTVGVFIRYHMIKGFLKYAAGVARLNEGFKISGFASKIIKFVHIYPTRIRFTQDGEFVKTPHSEIFVRPIKITDKTGTRTAISRSEQILYDRDHLVTINFKVKIFDNPDVDGPEIEGLLGFGLDSGLGCWRNGGYGRFILNLFEEIEAPTGGELLDLADPEYHLDFPDIPAEEIANG